MMSTDTSTNRNEVPMAPRVALLLALAVLAPLCQARADSEVCQLDPVGAPDKIYYFDAVVIGPANDAEVLAQTRIAILRTKAPVSPAYVNLPRIDAIYRDADGSAHRTIAAVITGLLPAHGAHVRLASRHRDPNQPCAFIPWTVARPGDAV
jgi:hypothetical protein